MRTESMNSHDKKKNPAAQNARNRAPDNEGLKAPFLDTYPHPLRIER